MDKGTITISVPSSITHDELRKIRQDYKHKDYRINILISGHESTVENISNFIIAQLK